MTSKFAIKKTFKIQKEPAMEIMIKFCERFDIDVESLGDKKAKNNTEHLLNCLLDYVMRGIIEIHDDGSITQHLKNNPGDIVKIDYKKITGKQKLVMDGKDENDRYEMMYAVLGAASGLGESAIMKLSGIDLKAAEALTIAFL